MSQSLGRVAVPAPLLGVVLLLAGLLTWLMLNGSEEDAAYFRAQRSIDAIALAESRLQHDVLRARTGLLRNYDPIVALVGQLEAAAAGLAAADPGDADVRAIAAAVARESALVERFKTDNALVQNSVSFFDALSERLSDPDVDPDLARDVAALQVRVSEYAREASRRRLEDLRGRLDALEREHAAEPSPAHLSDIASIVRHGRQLLALMPQVDAISRSLPAASSERARARFVAAREAEHARLQAHADRYRFALYLIALVLVGLLVRVGLRMRSGTLILRRIVDFQTVIARASNLFLASQPEETTERIVDVLAILGSAIETDHGYLLWLDADEPPILWSRAGLGPPSGWPGMQQAMIPDVLACAEERIFIEMAKHEGPAALRAAIAARGAVSWSCMRVYRGERVVGLLCFERYTSALPGWLRHSRGLRPVIGDIFGAALDRQHIWQERREMEAALRRAQRLESIGTFTSGVAHNINNVLNVMLGHAEIAAGTLAPDTRGARQLGQLMQAGARAREITSQILDFGRRSGPSRQAAAIDAVVAETVTQLRASMAEPVTIRFEGGTRGASVGGDPAQLQQVVLNLIRNAAQASKPGDVVTVELALVEVSAPLSLSHGTLRRGVHARLRVADTGRGMDEATRARIFEPFFTTRLAGTGLGLATAFEFVRGQDGAFAVRSAPGAGSVFEVWLPVTSGPASGAPAAGPAAGHPLGPAAASAGTLMLVGCSRAAVLQDEETLAALGFEPVGFADAEPALSALRESPERFDLVIVESRLAGMSGLDFAKQAARITAAEPAQDKGNGSGNGTGNGAARHPPKPIILSLPAIETIEADILSAAAIVDVVRRPWRSEAIAAALSRHPQDRTHSGVVEPG